jgi:4-hydroxybutyryl-CoA dehydratase/vinylacetyl-CoA-Delta-isomerase
MPMKTAEEYIDSLRQMKPRVFVQGERVISVIDHPLLRPAVNTLALTYSMAQDPRYQELMTATSNLTGEVINRFNHLYLSPDDLVKKLNMVRVCAQKALCILRCMGGEALNGIAVGTYAIDQNKGTDYYQRFLKFARYFQENDLICAQAVTDVKGDRSLRPYQQADADLFLRVVDRRPDGIIVRGAKDHITGAAASHYIFAMPSRVLTEKDKDYAVAFVVPCDVAGLTHIVNTSLKSPQHQEDLPASSKYSTVESLLIFDDVLVPWENVFMCGEWDAMDDMLFSFATTHRHSRCACSSGVTDILTGASSLIAKYNGLEKASHIRDKLIELSVNSETYYACGYAASLLASKAESGYYLPDILYTNVGKLWTARLFHESVRLVQEIAGGLIDTVPSVSDWENSELRPFIEKYLKGRADVPTEYRLRLFRLLQDMTTYGTACYWLTISAVGAGSPQGAKIMVSRETDFTSRERLAKELAGIPAEG